MQIRDSESPVSPTELAELESRLGIQLPLEYRDFLLVHNGGWPTPDSFEFRCRADRYSDSCVDRFLAVYEGEYDNFESYFETYKTRRARVPLDFVPIAHDPGGNLVCIAVSGQYTGAVFFWDHELEAYDGHSPTFENVHLIAESFNKFMTSLKNI